MLSSLLRCLCRFPRVTAGLVRLDGEDIGKLKPKALARRVATMLQEPASDFGLAVAEIVELGLTPRIERFSGRPSAMSAFSERRR